MRRAPLLAIAALFVACGGDDAEPTQPTVDAATDTTATSDAEPGEVSGDGAIEDAGAPTPVVPPTRDTILQTLRAGHPRLVLLAPDIARIQGLIAAGGAPQKYRDAMVKAGTDLLTKPPLDRVLIGPRLLSVSRGVLDRIWLLGLLHRLDPANADWSKRAIQELSHVAGYVDWNPSHFLDVAEMTHAFALGYDWFFDAMTAAERATVRTALVQKGLREGEKAYVAKAWWTRDPFNWNLVCHGGLIAGALAVADEEPELAKTMLLGAIANAPKAFATYAPDGAWAEGPGYWGYATRYAIVASSTLQSALNGDFGFSASAGFMEGGKFRIDSVGPTGKFFNFADAGENAGREPSLSWLGRRFDRALYAWAGRTAAGTSGSALDLAFYDPRGTPDDLAKEPLDARYVQAHLGYFRGAWGDANATWLAFKGGDNQANHAHLDLGTFVLDAAGQRWAIDLGPDDYNLPGYFGDKRWTYYRLMTRGQNTLTFDLANQDVKATAPITTFVAKPGSALALVDLTAGYAASASQVRRGFALLDGRKRVAVQDEATATKAGTWTWTMHTKASVTVSGAVATLTQSGATLEARLVSPSGASFVVEDVLLAAPQTPATGVRRLMVKVATSAGATTRIGVVFGVGAGSTTGVTLASLDAWPSSGATK